MNFKRDLNEVNQEFWKRFNENLRKVVKNLEFDFDPKPITAKGFKVSNEELEMETKRRPMKC